MTDRCLEFWMLVRLADELVAEPETTVWRAHVGRCERCGLELDGIRATESQIAALGAAEHDRTRATSVGAWNRIHLAAKRPALATRLPMRVAGLGRDLAAVAHPALAGATVAMVAGLAAGTWLAVTVDRSPAAAAATEMYDTSNLLDAASTGLSTWYLDASDMSGAGAMDTPGSAPSNAETPATTSSPTRTPVATPRDSAPAGRP